MLSEVFLTPVAEPHAKDLRNFFSFALAETFVEGERFPAFAAAGSVAMRIPEAPSRADAATGFLEQGRAG